MSNASGDGWTTTSYGRKKSPGKSGGKEVGSILGFIRRIRALQENKKFRLPGWIRLKGNTLLVKNLQGVLSPEISKASMKGISDWLEMMEGKFPNKLLVKPEEPTKVSEPKDELQSLREDIDKQILHNLRYPIKKTENNGTQSLYSNNKSDYPTIPGSKEIVNKSDEMSDTFADVLITGKENPKKYQKPAKEEEFLSREEEYLGWKQELKGALMGFSGVNDTLADTNNRQYSEEYCALAYPFNILCHLHVARNHLKLDKNHIEECESLLDETERVLILKEPLANLGYPYYEV